MCFNYITFKEVFMSKIFLLAFFIFSSVSVFAQDTMPSPQSTPASLDTILTEAAKQKSNYSKTFTDLLATETKTVEKYKKDGSLDESVKVESNFFVYQVSDGNNRAYELRNIIKVNEKPIPDSQSRADRFLGELQKDKTGKKLLDKIEDESSRYDKSFKITNLTLFPAITLTEAVRSYFDFNLIGTENYQGRDVYVVGYRQTKKSPNITINEKKPSDLDFSADFDVNIPGSLKKNEKFLQGKLWIDAQNFQLLREERQIAVQVSTPIVVQETAFEYKPSQYEIYVPQKIVFTDYVIKKGSDKNNFSTVKNAQMTFDYSEFKRTNVDIEILDDDESQ